MVFQFTDQYPENTPANKKYLNWDFFSTGLKQSDWNLLLNETDLVIDLQNLAKIFHDGLIWIFFILYYRSNHNKSTKIILPVDPKQIRLLKEYKLQNKQYIWNYSFENNYNWVLSPDISDKIPQCERLLKQIHPIKPSTMNDVEYIITSEAQEYLRGLFNPKNIGELNTKIENFFLPIRELLHNIYEHGGIKPFEGEGLVTFSKDKSSFFSVRYCFSDLGLGFKKTLLDQDPGLKEKIKNDEDALLYGILYRKLYPKSGVVGIFPALEFIAKSKGALVIRSGSRQVKLSFKDQRGISFMKDHYYKESITISDLRYACTFSGCPTIPGTHIYLDLSIQ